MDGRRFGAGKVTHGNIGSHLVHAVFECRNDIIELQLLEFIEIVPVNQFWCRELDADR